MRRCRCGERTEDAFCPACGREVSESEPEYLFDVLRRRSRDVWGFVRAYGRTLRTSILRPSRLEKLRLERLALPSGRFLLASAAIQVLVIRALWPEDPVSAYERPTWFARFRALDSILESVPLIVPVYHLFWSLLVATWPYLAWRLVRRRAPYRELLQIFADYSASVGTLVVIALLGLICVDDMLLAHQLQVTRTLEYHRGTMPLHDWHGAEQYVVPACRVLAAVLGLIWLWRQFVMRLKLSRIAGATLLAVAVFANGLLMQAVLRQLVGTYRVSSQAMEIGLILNDIVLTNNSVYRVRAPARGEVVAFQGPMDELTSEPSVWMFRVIGLPGERVTMRECVVSIDGVPLEEPYARYFATGKGGPLEGEADAVDALVPSSHYFVMGDNRDNSRDSRVIGAIPRAAIIGKAYFRIRPIRRAEVIW